MSAPQTFESKWSRNVYETKSVARHEPDTSYEDYRSDSSSYSNAAGKDNSRGALDSSTRERTFSNIFEAAVSDMDSKHKRTSTVKSQRNYRDSIDPSPRGKKSKERHSAGGTGRIHNIVESSIDPDTDTAPLKPVVKEVFIPDFDRSDSEDNVSCEDDVNDDDAYADDDENIDYGSRTTLNDTGGLSAWKGLASALGRPSVDVPEMLDEEADAVTPPWRLSAETRTSPQTHSSIQERQMTSPGHAHTAQQGNQAQQAGDGCKAKKPADANSSQQSRNRHHKQSWQARNRQRKGGAGIIRPKKERDTDGEFSLKPAKYGSAWEPLGKLPVDPYDQKALAETSMSTRAREDFGKVDGNKRIPKVTELSPERQERLNRLALPKELTRVEVHVQQDPFKPTLSPSKGNRRFKPKNGKAFNPTEYGYQRRQKIAEANLAKWQPNSWDTLPPMCYKPAQDSGHVGDYD
eukprot:m.516694 g.516694  ORF g.516694 m.516694 type:complete len:462 (-) comp21931_c0_seq1:876-2261(-)